MTHAPNRSARRPRRAEQIFALASAVIALRVVDDELLQPAAGTSIADHPAALLVPLALAGLAVVFFPRLRAGAQSLSALVFAALALVGGGIAFATLRVEGLHGSVWSGLVLLPAGVALLVLSIVILWRARRRRHLLGILLVQMAVGETQYRTYLTVPWWLVLIHVIVAAALFAWTVGLVARLWRPVARNAD